MRESEFQRTIEIIMYGNFKQHIENTINEIRDAGLYKNERVIDSSQDARIDVGGREVLNMCANNYLGLSDNPEIVESARKALDEWGYGLSSARALYVSPGCRR